MEFIKEIKRQIEELEARESSNIIDGVGADYDFKRGVVHGLRAVRRIIRDLEQQDREV